MRKNPVALLALVFVIAGCAQNASDSAPVALVGARLYRSSEALDDGVLLIANGVIGRQVRAAGSTA
jgi:hypothetical protein